MAERACIQVRGETVKRLVQELAQRMGLSEAEIIRIAVARLYMLVLDGQPEE